MLTFYKLYNVYYWALKFTSHTISVTYGRVHKKLETASKCPGWPHNVSNLCWPLISPKFIFFPVTLNFVDISFFDFLHLFLFYSTTLSLWPCLPNRIPWRMLSAAWSPSIFEARVAGHQHLDYFLREIKFRGSIFLNFLQLKQNTSQVCCSNSEGAVWPKVGPAQPDRMPVDWCPLFFCAPAPPAPSSRLRQLLPGWRMQCTSRENPGLPSPPPPPPLAGSFVPISLSFFAGCEAAYCCCVHLCICGSNKSLSGCVMENYPLWEEDRQLWQILKIPLSKLQLCSSSS